MIYIVGGICFFLGFIFGWFIMALLSSNTRSEYNGSSK
jgi:hypothetical protein